MQVPYEPILNPFDGRQTSDLDDELVKEAIAGGRESLETLLTRHLPWIFNLSMRMLHRRADAEDATQEILLEVIQALPGFRGDARFSTWLYQIAVNHLLNIKKSKWAVTDAICSFGVAADGLR